MATLLAGTDRGRDQALADYRNALDGVEEQTALVERYFRELQHARSFLTRSPSVTPVGVSSRTIAAESYAEAAARAARVVDRLVQRVGILSGTVNELASTICRDSHPNQVGSEHATSMLFDGTAVGQ